QGAPYPGAYPGGPPHGDPYAGGAAYQPGGPVPGAEWAAPGQPAGPPGQQQWPGPGQFDGVSGSSAYSVPPPRGAGRPGAPTGGSGGPRTGGFRAPGTGSFSRVQGTVIKQRDSALPAEPPAAAKSGPIAIEADNVAAFARDLRVLRAKAELDYPDMAE